MSGLKDQRDPLLARAISWAVAAAVLVVAIAWALRLDGFDTYVALLFVLPAIWSVAAALDIAATIKARRLRVVVDGVCMSACSQYLLLSAARGQVLAGSLVAFHTSSYAIHDWSSRYAKQSRDYQALSAGSAALSARTAALFPEERHRSLLIGAFAFLRPTCIAPPAQAAASDLLRIRLTEAFLVPTRSTLARYGIEMPPDWPGSVVEAALYIGPHLRAEALFAFRDPQESVPAVPMVPRCA